MSHVDHKEVVRLQERLCTMDTPPSARLHAPYRIDCHSNIPCSQYVLAPFCSYLYVGFSATEMDGTEFARCSSKAAGKRLHSRIHAHPPHRTAPFPASPPPFWLRCVARQQTPCAHMPVRAIAIATATVKCFDPPTVLKREAV